MSTKKCKPNAKCPCGSGKKFKKCCNTKTQRTKKHVPTLNNAYQSYVNKCGSNSAPFETQLSKLFFLVMLLKKTETETGSFEFLKKALDAELDNTLDAHFADWVDDMMATTSMVDFCGCKRKQ